MWSDLIVAMDAWQAVGLLLSAGIGLSLGLIGGGGSLITVPLLVYVMGVEPHAAMAMSLGVVGATSLAGAALHHGQGTVRLRIGLIFAAAGMLGAYFGTRLTYLLSDAALLLTFGGLMIVVAGRMLTSKPRESGDSHRPAPLVATLAAGAGVGVLTGFLGVGGGFLIVPALVAFVGLDLREAVRTSLLVIAINSVGGVFGHIGADVIDLRLAVPLIFAALLGAFAGERFMRALSTDALRRGFAVLILVVGVVAGTTTLLG